MIKKNKFFFKCFFSIFLCFFSSCVLKGGVVSVGTNSPKSDDEMFSLEVLEKINDGEKIYILGQITSEVKAPVKDVVLNLRLLDINSKVVSEHAYILSKLMGKDKSEFINADEPKKFLISTDLKKSTDFQLELLWGEEALKKFTKPNAQAQTSTKTEVLKMSNLYFDKKIVSPSGKDLQYYFVISGDFENLSDKVVKEISLAVSFKSKIGDKKLSNDEEFLEIKDVALKPKSTKKFEMELETILSGDEVNLYTPDIRIVSFSH